jgi:hypothetical protein
MDDDLKSLFRKILLWFEDLLRITFLPSGRNVDKVIERERSFGESIFLLILSLAAASLVGLLKAPLASVFANFAISIFAVPVMLVIYAAILKKMIRNPKQAARHHEGLFHIGILAFSAGSLLGAPFILLPEPFGTIFSSGILVYCLLIIGTLAIRRMLIISIVPAFGMNLAALLLTMPLYILLSILFRLFSSSVRNTIGY